MTRNFIKFGSERKFMTKSLIATVGLAMALTTPAFASIDWSFASDPDPGNTGTLLNPVVISPDAGGTATASLYKGVAGGWVPGGLDTTTQPYSPTGYWDPGKSGYIVLAPPSGSGISSLTVLQFTDGFIYAGVTVSGGTPSSSVISSGGGPGGQWEKWVWTFSTPVSSLTINSPTAPGTGAIIDQISIATAVTAVPEPSTIIAAVLLLLPFGLSTIRILRSRKVLS
jgi:hypothetical protein